MADASALYLGAVMHRRLRPKRHKLRYSIFSILIDLDEAPALDARLRLFSRNRFNLFSFREADYGLSKDAPLKQQIEGMVREAGFAIDGGPVAMRSIRSTSISFICAAARLRLSCARSTTRLASVTLM
jgi:DUF1365 family protein